MESAGEEHVFFLHKPECEESLALMDRLVAFLGQRLNESLRPVRIAISVLNFCVAM